MSKFENTKTDGASLSADKVLLAPIISGFGFRENAEFESFAHLFKNLAKPNRKYIAAVPEDKAAHPEFVRFCAEYGLEIHAVSQNKLEDIITPTQSAKSLQFRNVGSVCEAAALILAGEGATLVVQRQLSDDKRVSCAMSEVNKPN